MFVLYKALYYVISESLCNIFHGVSRLQFFSPSQDQPEDAMVYQIYRYLSNLQFRQNQSMEVWGYG